MEKNKGVMSYGAISSAAPLLVESCDVDPWAIVDLVDDSEKWTGT